MKRYYSEKIAPHLLPTAILLVITAAVYIRILGHDFQLFWDDEKYVLANQMIKKLSLENLKSVFTRNYLGNYAPLQLISYIKSLPAPASSTAPAAPSAGSGQTAPGGAGH